MGKINKIWRCGDTENHQLDVWKDYLRLEKRKLQLQIKKLPRGELLCARNGKYMKYYISNGANPKYIPKKKRKIAEALATKKLYQYQLKELAQEEQLFEDYQKRREKIVRNSEELCEADSEYATLMAQYFENALEEGKMWASEPYEKNPYYPEKLIFKTMAGEYVRSKSEVIIANMLYINGIPYRYEQALYLDTGVYYPDFTLLNVKKNKRLYWEHFGMLDKVEYRDKAFNKMKVYGNNQIYPMINLLTTYETKDHPIDSEQVQQMIDTYLK